MNAKLTIEKLRISTNGGQYGPYSTELSEFRRAVFLSGAADGKSALAETIAGIIPTFSSANIKGRVILDGVDQLGLSVGERRKNFGLVFQDPEAMICTLDVRSELAFELENIGLARAEIIHRIEDVAKAMGIDQLLDRRIDTLSAGQLQRLAVATMLVTAAPVILYDDPYKNIDPIGRREFASIVNDAHAHNVKSIICSSQLHEDWPSYDIYVVQDCVELKTFRGWRAYLNFMTSKDFKGSLIAVPTELEIIALIASRRPELIERMKLSDENQIIWPRIDLNLQSLAHIRSQNRSSGGKPVIRFQDLTYRYPRSGAGVENASGVIHGPGITAMIGGNGAGKSTLAKLLTGLLVPKTGEIEIDGQRIGTGDVRGLAQRASYVFQEPRHQFLTDSVADEIRFSLRDASDEDQDIQVDKIADLVGLTKQKELHPYRLTPSEQRLLSLASAIAADKRILFVDEPTYGLDRIGFERIKAILDELVDRGKTIILISHDMDFVADVATWCLTLGDGRVAFNGPFETVGLNDTAGLWPSSKGFLQAAGAKNPGDWFVPRQGIFDVLDHL